MVGQTKRPPIVASIMATIPASHDISLLFDPLSRVTGLVSISSRISSSSSEMKALPESYAGDFRLA
jgi:hypothetical protein